MKNKLIKVGFFLVVFSFALKAELLLPSKVYELAVVNSNKIKSTEFRIKSKKEDLNQIKARFYPQLDMSLDYSNTDFERNELVNASTMKFNEESIDYSIRLKQSIYNDETYTKLALEKKRVEISDLQLNIEFHELSKDVYATYINAFKAKNKIEVLIAYVEFNKQKFKSIKKRFEMNLTDKMEFLKAKVDFDRAKINLEKEKKILNNHILKLKQQTSLEFVELPILDFKTFDISLFENILDTDYAYLENNLDILNLKKGIEFSKLETSNARSLHYPKLDFDASYTKYDSDDSTTDYENRKRFSLQLKIPIFQGGSVYSKVKSLKFKEKAALEDYELRIKELELEHNELKANIKASIESLNIYKEALVSSESYLKFVTLGYENGLKSIVDLLDSKNKMLEMKFEYLQSIEEFISSYINFMILNNNLEEIEKLDQLFKSNN